MKPELSVILPSIRVERLPNFYQTMLKSTTRSFELVIVGPYAMPAELEQYKNIKYVRDFGSANRAQSISFSLCEGELVVSLCDDGIMLDGTIDKHIDMLREMGPDPKNVVVGKYREGPVGSQDRETHHDDLYFSINGGPGASQYIPNDWWLFNLAFMHRSFMEELGGFDSKFEGTWCAHTDLAIRAQASGAIVKMSGIDCMLCDHMPGTTGDHLPIHECQTFSDVPLLNKIYRDPYWRQNRKLSMDKDDWKKEEIVWKRRFNETA